MSSFVHCFAKSLIAYVVLMLNANIAFAAYHDQFSGKDIAVHYVRLTGHAGNSERDGKLLAEQYQACVDVHKNLGLAIKALPVEGIPKEPRPETVEIYYSPALTLTIKKGKLHAIDPKDCALTVVPHHIHEISGPLARCTVDMLKKEARGFCDAESEKALPAHAKGFVKRPTDSPVAGKKTILGLDCEVVVRGDYEFCVAKPKSSFRIPDAPFNGGIPGLLMEARNPAVTLKADHVELELGVAKDFFELPSGIKVVSKSGGRQ